MLLQNYKDNFLEKFEEVLRRREAQYQSGVIGESYLQTHKFTEEWCLFQEHVFGGYSHINMFCASGQG